MKTPKFCRQPLSRLAVAAAAAGMAFALGGCEWLPMKRNAEPEPVAVVAPWVKDPQAYFEQMQNLDYADRRRQREQTLVDFLVQPDAARQLRLNLVLTASLGGLEEVREVASSLHGALARDYALPPEAAAFLASESLRLQHRIERLEEAQAIRAELEALRARYRRLQRNKAASDAALRTADVALLEAQEKIRALTAIEKSLESANGPP